MNDIDIEISILFVIGCKLKSDNILSQVLEPLLDIQSSRVEILKDSSCKDKDFFIRQLFDFIDRPESKKTGIILAYLENKMLPYIYFDDYYHLFSFTYSREYRISAIKIISVESNMLHLQEGYMDINIFEKLPEDDTALLSFAYDILKEKYDQLHL